MTWIRRSTLMTCLVLFGCGSAPEKPEFAENLVPVTGTVTWKGKPLSGATVRFLVPENSTAGQPADAITDAEGNYSLQTMMAEASLEERTGAVPAAYRVTISQILRPDGSPIPADMTEADAQAEGAVESLPAKYSHPEATTLREIVKAEPTVINFELKP